MDNETTNKQTTSTTAEASTTTAQTQPISITASTTPSQTTPITSIAPTAPTQTATAETLPAGYLANGSMMDSDGVMLPEYLEKYPQALAKALKPLSAASFQRAFLSKSREANKKKVPYSAKKNCAQGMMIAALKLVKRKKDPAPDVLLDMIRVVSESVVDDSSFSVMFTHLDAVYTFMLISGSRFFSAFLVELGALISVASTI